MSRRTQKVAQLLKQEISRILQEEIENPDLGFITVIRVEVSKDLKNALVLVSVLGEEEQQEKSLQIVSKAKGYIKKIIGNTLFLKYIPELKFKLDKSPEYSVYIDERIDDIRKEDERR